MSLRGKEKPEAREKPWFGLKSVKAVPLVALSYHSATRFWRDVGKNPLKCAGLTAHVWQVFSAGVAL